MFLKSFICIPLLFVCGCSFVFDETDDTTSGDTTGDATGDQPVDVSQLLLEQLPQQDSLEVFWPMEDNFSDTSENAHTLVVNGGVTFSEHEKKGGSKTALFNGTDGYLTAGDVLGLTVDNQIW